MRSSVLLASLVLWLGVYSPVQAWPSCWCPLPPMCGGSGFVYWYSPPIIYCPPVVGPPPLMTPLMIGMNSGLEKREGSQTATANEIRISPPRPLTTETIAPASADTSASQSPAPERPLETIRPAAFNQPPHPQPAKNDADGSEQIPAPGGPSAVGESGFSLPQRPAEPTLPRDGVRTPESSPPQDGLKNVNLPQRTGPMSSPPDKPSSRDTAEPASPPTFSAPMLTLPEIPKAPASPAVPDRPSPLPAPSSPLPGLVLPPSPAPAVPEAAPAPMDPAPPVSPESPRVPLPRPMPSETGLPPLVLPPVPEQKVTSQSSPLTSLPKVRAIPVAASTRPVAPGRGKVSLFNYSQRDWEVTIQGRPLTLPRRSYVDVEVPNRFQLRIGAGRMTEYVVPPHQVGIDLVIE